MTFAFQLGREPLLSVAELQAVCSSEGIPTNVTIVGNTIALLTVGKSQVEIIFTRLGGSIKLGVVRDELDSSEFLHDPVGALSRDMFVQSCFGKETSAAFAISIFGNPPQGFAKQIKKIGLGLKEKLKSRFSHVRFVISAEKTISSVTVKRNKLLRGLDLWMVFDKHRLLLIQTIAVQDYREFARHDYSRPASDAASGMLPPKLARMMVNLSGAGEASTLCDPFVGSGTVLQEAALLGVKTMQASDIDKKAVKNTEANMKWLSAQYKLPVDLHVARVAIEELDPQRYGNVTHIVTEIDLGPPLKHPPTIQETADFAARSSQLVKSALAFGSQLPKLAKIVLALPFWPLGDTVQYTNLELPKGFGMAASDHEILGFFPREHSDRGGYLYIRSGQYVGREVLVIAR